MQPMKTAPRDGTEILAFSEAGNWHPVKWVMPHRDYKWTNPTCREDYGYWGMRWDRNYNQADGQFHGWTPMPADPR